MNWNNLRFSLVWELYAYLSVCETQDWPEPREATNIHACASEWDLVTSEPEGRGGPVNITPAGEDFRAWYEKEKNAAI